MAAGVLVLAVGATYLPALGNEFIYDDHEVIRMQAVPDSAAAWLGLFAEPHFHGLPYYRPLVRASLLAQKAWHGDRPGPFHAVNALLAVAAGLAAWALLASPGLGLGVRAAWLAALLYALHPVMSSCVYPAASGRETLLPTVLALCGVAAWLRARRALAWTCCAAALLAKEQSVVVPVLFAWADACRVAADPPAPRVGAWAKRHAPAVFLLAGYFALRQRLFGGGEWKLAVLHDPAGPLLSFLYALQTSFAPFADLVYEPEPEVWLSPPRLVVAGLALAAIVLAARRFASPSGRSLAFLAGWLVLALLPTANLLEQEARFDERYVLLALLAPLAVLGTVLAALEARSSLRRVALAAALVLAVGLAGLSFRRAGFFHDDRRFAEQWLRTNPRSPDAHHALGLLLEQEGRLEEAVAHYEAAIRESPRSADLRHNLGTALAGLGREPEARRAFVAALAIDPEHPEANLNLGILALRGRRLDEAASFFRAALRGAPRLADAHRGLGLVRLEQGRFEEAETSLATALRLDPSDVASRAALAEAQRRARQTQPR